MSAQRLARQRSNGTLAGAWPSRPTMSRILEIPPTPRTWRIGGYPIAGYQSLSWLTDVLAEPQLLPL
jgi:hypothetical protein